MLLTMSYPEGRKEHAYPGQVTYFRRGQDLPLTEGMERDNESQARELRSSSLGNRELIKNSEPSSHRTKEECKTGLADKRGICWNEAKGGCERERERERERETDDKAGGVVMRDWPGVGQRDSSAVS